MYSNKPLIMLLHPLTLLLIVFSTYRVIVPTRYTKTIENRFGSTTMKDGADQMMNATNFAHGVSSTNWHLNWAEPAFHLYNPQSAQSQGYDHMFNAFHLLQINPSVQVMIAVDPIIFHQCQLLMQSRILTAMYALTELLNWGGP